VSAATFSSSSPASIRLRVARAVCSRLPPLISQRVRDLIYPLALAHREAITFTTAGLTGSPFSGSTADRVAYPFAVHGYFNWRNVAIARAVCRPGDVIFDVGANIGSETVAFSDLVGPGGAVYAFEPFPANVELLRRNAAQTRAGNVEVLALALGDHPTTVRFAVPDSGNSGSGYVLNAGTGTPAQTIEVACTTLDELSPQLRPPRLLVIDAEGHEPAILRGAERLLARDRPVIVLEALEGLLARAGSSPDILAAQLVALDYELLEIQRYTLSAIGGAGGAVPRDSDWLALPRREVGLADRIRRTVQRAGLMPVVGRLNPLLAR
jgi:FkbM family methyltransferase